MIFWNITLKINIKFQTTLVKETFRHERVNSVTVSRAPPTPGFVDLLVFVLLLGGSDGLQPAHTLTPARYTVMVCKCVLEIS